MQSFKSIIAIIFVFLLLSSNALPDDWGKTSDPPAGSNQFKVATGVDNGSTIQFLLETSGLGLFKSTNNGTTWDNIGLDGKGLTAIVDNQGNAGEYIVSASDGVYKTTDGGAAWQHYTSGIEGLFITEIISLVTTDNLAVGTVGNGVFNSTDGGETWQQLGTGLENKTVTSLKFIIYTGEDDGLYATTQNDGVWVYKPSAGTWAPINDGNNNLIGTTAIAGDSQGNLYASISPNICSTLKDPVFWQVETLFDFANTIIVAPNDQVFASSLGNGVNRRNSSGNWDNFSTGLPSDEGYIDVFNIDIDEDGILWAAVIPLNPTIPGGVFRTLNPVTDINDNIVMNPKDFGLEQNYPNPFNPSTKIKYLIPNSSFINLKVYDDIGNEVAILVNEEKSSGSYEVNFDSKGLSSGIYFYTLQAGSFAETKKMILMK